MARLYLHIGHGKTGSSSIQRVLTENRDILLENGYAYPSSQVNHTFLHGISSQNYQDWPHSLQLMRGRTSQSEVEQFFKECVNELESYKSNKNVHSVILSSESLANLSPGQCKTLHDILKSIFDVISVIIYLRPPISYLNSIAQQNIKSGAKTLEEIISNPSRSIFSPRKLDKSFIRHFGLENIVARKFTSKDLVNSDIVDDFCEAIGLNETVYKKFNRGTSASNSSLSREAVILSNFIAQERPQRLEKGGVNMRRTFTSHFEGIPGEKFILPIDIMETASEKIDDVISFSKYTFNIDLTEPGFAKREAAEPAWADETVRAIALKILELSDEIDHLQHEAFFAKGEIALLKGSPEKALRWLQKARALVPDDHRCLSLISQAHQALGNHKRALEFKALARNCRKSSPGP